MLDIDVIFIFIGRIFSDFLPELLGAGLGAYLGYRYGIHQERQMRREEEKALKKETIVSLMQELDYNSTVLGDEAVIIMSEIGEKIPYKITALSTSSITSTVASGRFSFISPLNQISVSEYYEECKRIMNKVNIVESTFQISNEDIETYRKEIIEIGDPLCDYITEIIINLKSELREQDDIVFNQTSKRNIFTSKSV